VPERRRFGMLPRFLLGAILVVVFTTAAGAAIAIGTISQIAADIALGGKQIQSIALTAPAPGAAQTIMVIGDDHSGPVINGVRLLHADTFMLIRLDPQHSQTSILSIPRDLLISFTHDGVAYTNQKFNAAYAVGGPDLVLRVVKQTLPGVAVNDVVDFSFSSFIGVVRAIGCVYVDVDHRYYNPVGDSYSAIDLQPGYQRLCANGALSYVRYRHTDSDFVRVARQQDFIRQAKEQLGLFDLLTKYDQIAKALGSAIDTNIRGAKEINDLLDLIAFSSSRPIRHVTFATNNQEAVISGEDYVTSTPALIRRSVEDFLDENPTAPAPPGSVVAGKTTPAAQPHNHHRASEGSTSSDAPDLFALTANNQPAALQLAPSVPFPVLLPRFETGEATANDPAGPNDARAYTIADESGRLYQGYRVDWQQNSGGYYGIEGTNWLNPPLFASPSATLTIHGRKYMFIDDGSHWHDIGWRSGNALYWVSNTLLEDLSNAQMLALAESARPLSALNTTS
jgi:LCP family protein required for cell wall assembly